MTKAASQNIENTLLESVSEEIAALREPKEFEEMTEAVDRKTNEDMLKAVDRAVAARTIYLSGPMKGYPDSNYPLFRAVTATLRRAGHTVYDPSEFDHSEPVFPIRRAFAAYAKFICEQADTLVLLPGWEKSKGAGAERALADNCGLHIVEMADLVLLV